jgi:formiminotetrahydrofolate cyclodeaminase
LIRILKLNESAISYCHPSVLADLGAGCEQIKAALDGMLLLAESNIQGLDKGKQANFRERIKKCSTVGTTLEKRITLSIQCQMHY